MSVGKRSTKMNRKDEPRNKEKEWLPKGKKFVEVAFYKVIVSNYSHYDDTEEKITVTNLLTYHKYPSPVSISYVT